FGEDGEQRDLRFATFFNTLAAWDGPGLVGLRSNDPGRAFTVAEPGMVSLLGLGLLGAGLNLRRRKRA
ncbi:MAG: PEP-CTERM sorting domain-containing protein, partial [Gammaproteobacteria bacterium]